MVAIKAALSRIESPIIEAVHTQGSAIESFLANARFRPASQSFIARTMSPYGTRTIGPLTHTNAGLFTQTV